jgi:hypothetical protein
MKRIVRSVLAVVAGIVFLSVVVEALEFGLVTLVHGGTTTEPETYFSIRNRGWFLALKLAYNTLAAVGAGVVAALIAGYAPLKHGLAVAALQTLAFAWAVTQPEVRQWTPGWMWAALILLSFAGIMAGACLRSRRVAAAAARAGSGGQ